MDGSFSRHRQLADALRDGIEAGRFPVGSRLPSEHELAVRHGVARGTVRQALATLRAEGTITVRRGARPVVVGRARTQTFSELRSFTSWARGIGERPSGKVVEFGRRPATAEETNVLELAAGAEVYGLVRIRLLGGQPTMVERTTFVDDIGVLVAAADLEGGSIYAALALGGVEVTRARHAIDAIAAGTADARLLGVPRRAPLLRDRRLGFCAGGRPIEYSDDRYRSDAVAFGVDNATAAAPLARLAAHESGVVDVHRRAG